MSDNVGNGNLNDFQSCHGWLDSLKLALSLHNMFVFVFVLFPVI